MQGKGQGRSDQEQKVKIGESGELFGLRHLTRANGA
jgi:hypothetical protein